MTLLSRKQQWWKWPGDFPRSPLLSIWCLFFRSHSLSFTLSEQSVSCYSSDSQLKAYCFHWFFLRTRSCFVDFSLWNPWFQFHQFSARNIVSFLLLLLDLICPFLIFLRWEPMLLIFRSFFSPRFTFSARNFPLSNLTKYLFQFHSVQNIFKFIWGFLLYSVCYLKVCCFIS